MKCKGKPDHTHIFERRVSLGVGKSGNYEYWLLPEKEKKKIIQRVSRWKKRTKEKNKEKIKAYYREYFKNRRKTDPKFAQRLRDSVKKSIQKSKSNA